MPASPLNATTLQRKLFDSATNATGIDTLSGIHSHSLSKRLLLGTILAIGYWLASALGQLLAIPPGYASAISPASGIAMAGLLLLGLHYWPAVLAGAMLVAIGRLLDSGMSTTAVILNTAIAVGATLQAIIAARLVSRYLRGPLILASERDIFGFYVLGGPLAHLLGATISVTTLLSCSVIRSDALAEQWWTWWIGDTIGALIFAPLTIMWCGSHKDWSSRRTIVTAPLLTVFAAALAAFLYASRMEWRGLHQQLADDAGEIAHAIERHVDIDVEPLHNFGAFLQLNPHIDAMAFEQFSNNIMTAHPEIVSLQWAPAIRSETTTNAHSASSTAAHDSTRSTAAQGFPVQFAAGLNQQSSIGVDLNSATPTSLRNTVAMVLANQQVNATITNSYFAPNPTLSIYHLIVILPVTAKIQNTPPVADKHLLGLVVAYIDTAALIKASIQNPTTLSLAGFTVTDTDSNNGTSNPIASHTLSNGDTRSTQSDKYPEATATARIVNRNWTVQLQPSPQYITHHKPSTAWMVLAGGLMFSSLISAGALLITGRGLSIETLVTQRTKELAHINETLADEICDHLNTEHALDKERESLKAVLNNLHEGILVFDNVGQLRIANGAAMRMHRQITGTELDLIRGPSPFSVLATDGKTPIDADELPQAHALRGDTIRDFEAVANTPGNELIWLSVNAQPLFTSDGKQHGAIMVVRDITDRREIERLKNEFVATVSHELRTPITSIRGSLGLLAGGATGDLNEKTKHLIDIAIRNSDRLALLINDLLDIEKIESGNMRFDLTTQSMNELVQHAVDINNAYAHSMNTSIQIVGNIPSVQVHVDADRILQVLANLLSNAAKFSPKGASVEIFAHTVIDDDNPIVRVCVRDHGPGIAEKFRNRLFKKFSQADSSDARTKSGTGLGLAICKAIIEHLGGQIGYDTELGKGTTFYFDLPVVGAAKAA
jgi:PAS domain S-box-containing protein